MKRAPEFALGSPVFCVGHTVRGDQSTPSADAVVEMVQDVHATLREQGITASSPPFFVFRVDGAEPELGLWCPIADEVGEVGISKAKFPAARYVVLQGVPLADLWEEFEGMTRWADERRLPWDLGLAHMGSPAPDVPPESLTIDLNLRLRPPRPRLVTRPTVRYLPIQFSKSPLTDESEPFVDTVRRVRALVVERGFGIEGAAFWSFNRIGREAEFVDGREVEFTLCLPLREEPTATGQEGSREQASGTYATVTHPGPLNDLDFTYQLLVDWVAAQGLRWEDGISVLEPESEREQDQSKWRVELAIRTLGTAEAFSSSTFEC